MEDFTYAQVSLHQLGFRMALLVLPTQLHHQVWQPKTCQICCSLEDAATASSTDSLGSLMGMEALQPHLLSRRICS